MGWVRLEDRFADNPKVEAVTDRALRVHIRGLCYSSGQLTDGHVPRTVARRFGSLKSIGELIAVGLWEEADRGYVIHDYLEFNPSREQVLAVRHARSNAARTRWSNANAVQPILGDGKGGLEQEEAFARFWQAYPKRAQEGAARSLFRTLVQDGRVDPETIISGAEAYARSVAGKASEWIASPLNWLRDGRWTDEYDAPKRGPMTQDEIDAEVEAFIAERRQ